MAGPPALVDSSAKQVATLMDGRGGGRNGRFQGKAKNLGKRAEASICSWIAWSWCPMCFLCVRTSRQTYGSVKNVYREVVW